MGLAKYALFGLLILSALNFLSNQMINDSMSQTLAENEDLIKHVGACGIGYFIAFPIINDSIFGYTPWFSFDDFIIPFFMMAFIVGLLERFTYTEKVHLPTSYQVLIFLICVDIYKSIGLTLLWYAGPVCINTVIRYSSGATPYLIYFGIIGIVALIFKASERKKKRKWGI